MQIAESFIWAISLSCQFHSVCVYTLNFIRPNFIRNRSVTWTIFRIFPNISSGCESTYHSKQSIVCRYCISIFDIFCTIGQKQIPSPTIASFYSDLARNCLSMNSLTNYDPFHIWIVYDTILNIYELPKLEMMLCQTFNSALQRILASASHLHSTYIANSIFTNSQYCS